MTRTSSRRDGVSVIQAFPLLLIYLTIATSSTSVGAFPPRSVGKSRYLDRRPPRRPLFAANDQDKDDNNNHVPPAAITSHHLSIEFCTGCQWMMRSAWMAQELLTTFSKDLDSITLIPNRASPGGVFTVRRTGSDAQGELLWDRKAQGGFPESKQLKQRVRDVIVPDRDLGHSDVTDTTASRISPADCVDCPDPETTNVKQTTTKKETTDNPVLAPQPNVAITYDHQWLLRASWLAQELLTIFPNDLNSVSLIPNQSRQDNGGGDIDNGGIFSVHWNNRVVLWDRRSGTPQQRHGFPEPQELSDMIREQLFGQNRTAVPEVEMDDEEAETLRSFFGVL